MQFECYICNESRRESDDENEWCCLIRCGHVYHTVCIDQWKAQPRENRVTCPVCRQPFRQYQILYGQNAEPDTVAPPDANEDNVERFSLRSVREAYDALIQRHSDTVDELNLEQGKVEELEKKARDVTKKLDLANFKLSMYEEMFGVDCSKNIDKLIQDCQNE